MEIDVETTNRHHAAEMEAFWERHPDTRFMLDRLQRDLLDAYDVGGWRSAEPIQKTIHELVTNVINFPDFPNNKPFVIMKAES